MYLTKNLMSRIYKEFLQLSSKKITKKKVKRLERCFTNEDIKMVSKCMKRCSVQLVISKMQIKTSDVLLHTIEWLTTKPDKHVNQLEFSYFAGKSRRWYNCFGKQFDSFLESYNPTVPFTARGKRHENQKWPECH